MRFCDFFIEYKIQMKEIKHTISLLKLPTHRKIFVISTFLIGFIGIILFIINHSLWPFIISAILLILTIVFNIIDSTKKNMRKMLDEHYSVYSQTRISTTINILKKYNIDISNHDKIDLLIEQAEEAKLKYDPFLNIKNPLKILSSIVIPIVAYVMQKIADESSTDELITQALQCIIIAICIWAILFSIASILKDVLYSDYNKYNDLIYDLKQIKIFEPQ